MNFLHKIKNKKLLFITKFLMVTVGSFLYASGIFLFLDPNSLASGGVSGLSIVLNHTFDLLPTGTWIVIFNVPLLIIAVWKFGFKFVLSTIYAIFLSSTFVNLGGKYIGGATNDPILASIAGPVLVSLGIGLLFHAGASTGGTDIVVKLLRLKFKSVSTGIIFLFCDCAVILVSFIAFKQLDLALYAGICVIIQTVVLDKLLYGFDSAKMMYIVSNKNDEISDRLLKELDVGVTVVHAHGGYTGQNKPTLMCVLKKHQLPRAKELIRQTDGSAFLIITNAVEILGEGYKSHDTADL